MVGGKVGSWFTDLLLTLYHPRHGHRCTSTELLDIYLLVIWWGSQSSWFMSVLSMMVFALVSWPRSGVWWLVARSPPKLGAQSRSCPGGSGSLNLETIQNTSDTPSHYNVTTVQHYNITALQHYSMERKLSSGRDKEDRKASMSTLGKGGFGFRDT